MKVPEFFRKPLNRLALFSAISFTIPYFAPLISQGSSEAHTWGFWPGRIIFIAALTAIMLLIARWIKNQAVKVSAAAAFWAIFELLIMFEAFMLCFVGHSFDQSFLLHFNVDAVSGEVMKVFWKPVTAILLVYFAAIAASAFLTAKVKEGKFSKKELPILLISIALFFLPGTPFSVLNSVIMENIEASGNQELNLTDIEKIHAVPGKNLVFIVVESLEQNYLNEQLFPNLIPNVTKWMKLDNALVFENMISAPQNTFDFLYQSHMGNYMYSITDSDYADKQVSLSMILKKAGYNTAFLKACTLDFASTGTFVEKVQYEKRMDWQHPEIKPQATELGEWGFRDYDLFEMAKGEFNKLAAQGKPFCFTLFTVDSHAPNGVIGKKSLSYTLPGGDKFSMLSALHTTDAALGKFLEFIKNSPHGKDTVVVVAGDHLVMKDMVPRGRSVQSMLEYKPRKNILAFILNGKEKGSVTADTWPVDLAPVILHQLGVTHNATFPCGVNILTQKDAAPRKQLSYAQFMELQKKRLASNKNLTNILETPITFTGDIKQLELNINHCKLKCDPLDDMIGTFMEFHAKDGIATQFKSNLDRDFIKLFCTNTVDRDFFYVVYSCPRNILHFSLSENDFSKCLLGAVIGGWYRYDAADKFSNLKLKKLDIPIPSLADAKFDVEKNIVSLKKDGWTFPLFSKTNTYFPQCAITGAADHQNKESIMRKHFHDAHEMKDFHELLNKRLEGKGFLTVIMPPDSELHKKFNVPAEKADHILRLHLSPDGVRTELVSMRLPGEYYIARNGKGNFALMKENTPSFKVKLNGPAPAMEFSKGLCYAITMEAKSGKLISTRSFKQSRIAAELMRNRNPEHKTLLICGKNSEFITKYYPTLADKNVLFLITPSHIRHTIQYSNGNFRIPDANEPLDVLAGASAQMADDMLIISWGNASFIYPKAAIDDHIAKNQELVIKLQQHNPADFVSFTVNDPAWLPDISKAWKTDFLILGFEKGKLPEILQQKRQNKFHLALSRGLGWEFYWSDKINFSVKPAIFKYEK